MNTLTTESNYILAYSPVSLIPTEFPKSKTVYTENEDSITLFEESRGTLVILKDDITAGLWENGVGGPLFTLEDLRTFLRENTANFSPATGGSVAYGTNLFVNSVNGNDLTAEAGNPGKPYYSMAAAINYAYTAGATSTNRILIYVVNGVYSPGFLTLVDFVDIYAEPGVLFSGAVQFTDGGTPRNSKIFGFARISASYTGQPVFHFRAASNIFIEIDELLTPSTILLANLVTVGSSNIYIKANRIESTLTLGAAWAISLRNNTNVQLDIKEYIKANHSIIETRNRWTGKLLVNTPKLILTAANVYGGSYKQALIVYSAAAESIIEINGNIYNETPTYLGSNSGLIVNWGSNQGKTFINGNIYAGAGIGVYSNNTGAGKLTVKGSIYSDLEAVLCTGIGLNIFRDGSIITSGDIYRNIYVNGSPKVYFINCNMYMGTANANNILIESAAATLSLYNCIGDTNGAAGEFLASSLAVTVLLHNVISRKPLGALVTNTLTLGPGFIQDPNLLTPQF